LNTFLMPHNNLLEFLNYKCIMNTILSDMKKKLNIHPGAILQEEYLEPFRITSDRLSQDAQICLNKLNELLKGEQKITEEIAAKLADFFGTTPQFWLTLQSNYD